MPDGIVVVVVYVTGDHTKGFRQTTLAKPWQTTLAKPVRLCMFYTSVAMALPVRLSGTIHQCHTRLSSVALALPVRLSDTIHERSNGSASDRSDTRS